MVAVEVVAVMLVWVFVLLVCVVAVVEEPVCVVLVSVSVVTVAVVSVVVVVNTSTSALVMDTETAPVTIWGIEATVVSTLLASDAWLLLIRAAIVIASLSVKVVIVTSQRADLSTVSCISELKRALNTVNNTSGFTTPTRFAIAVLTLSLNCSIKSGFDPRMDVPTPPTVICSLTLGPLRSAVGWSVGSTVGLAVVGKGVGGPAYGGGVGACENTGHKSHDSGQCFLM